MDFVNFDLAKKLEEKGFTLPKSEIIGKFDSDGLFHSQLYINFTETMDLDEIIAPTISQVLKWLRKEKKMHIAIDITDFGFVANTVSFKRDKSRCESELEHYDYKGYYSTYEEAGLAEIDYVLDNLI